MTFGQGGLDGGLALQQPVQGGVELVLVDLAEAKCFAKARCGGRGGERTGGGELGGGFEDPADEECEDEVAAANAVGAKDTSRPIPRAVPRAAATWPCGRLRVTVKASRSAAMTVPPLSTPRRPSTWTAGQSDRLQRVRLRTLPPSR
jgi:hypothetical protein